MQDPLGHDLPGLEVGLLGLQPEALADLPIQSLLEEPHRDLVDRLHVRTLDDAAEIHVAEQGDLALDLRRQRLLAPADQDVGLNSDLHQIAHGMLGRLGLELARGGDVRHQGEMDEERVVASDFLAELADGLEERQRFDVADGSADFGDDDVVPGRRPPDGVLDLVGDVGNHLDGGAEVLAPALLVDHRLIDPAGGDVVLPGERPIDESLVVSQVQIGFRPVVGDEDLAVLKRRHGPGIDVDVGIELLHRHAQSALDEQSAKRSGGDALPQRGHDAAGDEDVLGRVRTRGH